jgi:transposase-like protein
MFKFSYPGANVQAANRTCPLCNSSYLDRVPRRFIDRIISLFVSVRRYQCESCGWCGNLKLNRE